MKTKIIIMLTIAATTTLLLTQCKKEGKNDKTYKSYFWTSKVPSEAALSLFIDGQYKGELPYLQDKLTCFSHDTLKQKALFLTLNAGKYEIAAKDKQGNIKSSSTLKVKSGLLESSGGVGGQGAESSGDCLVVELFY